MRRLAMNFGASVACHKTLALVNLKSYSEMDVEAERVRARTVVGAVETAREISFGKIRLEEAIFNGPALD